MFFYISYWLIRSVAEKIHLVLHSGLTITLLLNWVWNIFQLLTRMSWSSVIIQHINHLDRNPSFDLPDSDGSRTIYNWGDNTKNKTKTYEWGAHICLFTTLRTINQISLSCLEKKNKKSRGYVPPYPQAYVRPCCQILII